MALTIDALKGLFKKLGGSDSGFAGVNTIPEAIDKVTSVASSGGGGSDLPEPGVTGNVLTSTGDTWESAAPRYIINMSNDNHPTHDSDPVEISDIIAAYNSGKNCIIIYDGGMYRLASVEADMVVFTVSAVTENELTHELTDYMAYTWLGIRDGDDAWYKFGYTIPIPSATNNGKILGVDSGVYTLKSPAELSLAPLVIEGTVSGSTFTQTSSVTAEQVRDAIAAHRPIYIDIVGGRFYYNAGGYSAADAFTFSFAMQVYDADDAKMKVTMIVFDNTMATGTVQSLAFTPTT